jgi:hypothetical protein
MRLGLGPTNPGMIIIAQETSLFRPKGFSPFLWLLIPAFSLPHAPRLLSSAASLQRGTLLYHVQHKLYIHVFGNTLEPRYIFHAKSLDE